MELKDGHYSYQNNQQVRKDLGLAKFKTQDKCYVLYVERGDYFLTYDGEYMIENRDLKYGDLCKSKRCVYKKFAVMKKGCCSAESQELLKKLKDENNTIEYEKLLAQCLQEYYHNFMKDCEDLKQLTEGRVDLKEHQYDLKHCVLKEFWKRTRTYHFEEIDEVEDEWLRNTNNCGLMYSEPAEGEMNVYDVNSFYPHLMKNPKLLIPCGKPSYETWKSVPEFVKLGI